MEDERGDENSGGDKDGHGGKRAWKTMLQMGLKQGADVVWCDEGGDVDGHQNMAVHKGSVYVENDGWVDRQRDKEYQQVHSTREPTRQHWFIEGKRPPPRPVQKSKAMKETRVKRASEAKEIKDAKKKQQLSVKDQKARKRQSRKERKEKKDPNKPKRAPTAFFIYLEDFRKIYKEEHPDVKGVAAVGKACGDKWKEMSDEEKAPYVEKAAQKRAEYEKALASYHQKQSTGASTAVKGDQDQDEEDNDEEGSEEEDDDEDEE
ncbi:hypothetical protein GOP47_0011500 [Adiantum capillus-veneris]|uniref:HMG box domain-containing protein n=1 Tax=Adiantum capillus-veneris TaxID=13818 RepID=A0A9D4UTD4_ADICA|nr:hypothetical protein GOP47_0011500 [Adiantum capillus-veneris]